MGLFCRPNTSRSLWADSQKGAGAQHQFLMGTLRSQLRLCAQHGLGSLEQWSHTSPGTQTLPRTPTSLCPPPLSWDPHFSQDPHLTQDPHFVGNEHSAWDSHLTRHPRSVQDPHISWDPHLTWGRRELRGRVAAAGRCLLNMPGPVLTSQISTGTTRSEVSFQTLPSALVWSSVSPASLLQPYQHGTSHCPLRSRFKTFFSS